MKVTELRIGNLVRLNFNSYHELEVDGYLNDNNNIWIVKRIEDDGDISIYNKIENLFEFERNENIEPITLTEEWLIRLSFSVITQNSAGKRYGYVINGIFSSDLTFVYWTTTKLKGRFFRSDLELKHVHQLQNLYFALTNKELKLCQ